MDRTQFEHLALEHLDAVYRLALQLVRHPDEASDLVQETYLKALRVAEGFQETGGGMRPWLFKILHNVLYTRLAKARRGPVSMEDFHETADRGPAPDEPEPARDLSTLDWDHVDERLDPVVRVEFEGRSYDVFERSRWERSRQQLDVTYEYIPRGGGEVLQGRLLHRYLLRDQLAPLLEQAGLRLESLHGDWHGHPSSSESDMWVATAAPERAA